MRPGFVFAPAMLAIALNFAAGVWAQPLAPEGRGLLPEVNQPQGETLGGTPPKRPFVLDTSGVFRRTLFSADTPGFRLEIRDYAAPPDNKPHTVALQEAAIIEQRSSGNALRTRDQPFALRPGVLQMLPPGEQMSFLNSGSSLSVTRVILLQAKQP